MIDRAAMQRAIDEADDFLGQALQILGEPAAEGATPEQLGRAHALAGSYVALGAVAIDRFEEAARGA